MATPPTRVALYATGMSWDAMTVTKTVSVTVAAGDTLVVQGTTEDQAYTLGTPSGGGLTYTLRQSVVVSAYTTRYVWTAPVGSGATFDVSITKSGGSGSEGRWGFLVERFSGSDGIGASAKTNVLSDAPSLAITTTGANSALSLGNSDWNATDGASRTYRTVNVSATEENYFRNSAAYTVYDAYHTDTGAAGAKTCGLSAPSGQKYSIVAVEILGSSSGTQTVVLELITASSTLFNPTVVPGSVTVVLPLINAPSTLFNPGVIQFALVPLLSVPSTVFNPTVIPGTVIVVTPLIEVPSTVFQPVVSAGGVIITPVIDTLSTVFEPTVVNLLQIVVAQLLSVPSNIFNPTVTGGGAPTVAGSIADQARVNMLVEVGGVLDSNTDLMRQLILDGDQTLITVTSASAAVQLIRYMMDLRE